MPRAASPAGLAIAALIAASAGCKAERAASGAEGHERGECRADKTCDVGLLCLSSLCVRPPAASCKDIGEKLASLELGNYAEPEARAPSVAKYQAACEAAKVSRDEQRCVDEAGDRWRAAQCVPRMFPELTAAAPDCPAIITRIRAATAQQPAYGSDGQMKTWLDRTMAVMQESCEQDRWPEALRRCVLAGAGTQALNEACAQQMPPGLQQQIQNRLAKAMQDAAH